MDSCDFGCSRGGNVCLAQTAKRFAMGSTLRSTVQRATVTETTENNKIDNMENKPWFQQLMPTCKLHKSSATGLRVRRAVLL